MKKQLFFYSAFLIGHLFNNYAMDAPNAPSKAPSFERLKAPFPPEIKQYPLEQKPQAVVCGRKGKCAILHPPGEGVPTQYCSVVDYRNGEVKNLLEIGVVCSQRLFVHQYSEQLIMGIPSSIDGIYFWSENLKVRKKLNEFGDHVGIKCTSNILFEEKNCFFINAGDNALIQYNYELSQMEASRINGNYQDRDVCFEHIFTCPSEKKPYFLCSDHETSGIYDIQRKESCFVPKALLDIDQIIDKTTWAYSSLGYICAITTVPKELYVINTQTLESRIWKQDVGGPIYAVAVHPNQRICALLLKNDTEKMWKICWVDSKAWHPILEMNLRKPLVAFNRSSDSDVRLKPGQYIAISPYGKKIIAVIPNIKELFVARIPSLIRCIGLCEKKFNLIKCFGFSTDLENIIKQWFIAVIKKY